MALQILLSLVSGKGWKIQHIDVQAAFLQGRKITRDIYITPPFEAESDKIWKLCMYVLCMYGWLMHQGCGTLSYVIQ